MPVFTHNELIHAYFRGWGTEPARRSAPGFSACARGAGARGGDEGETAHAPCVRRGGVNGYSHLLNGSVEACLQPPRAGDASVMLNEDMGSSGNHFGSSLVTSDFAAARSAAAHGDDFTAFLRLHTLITFLHLLLFQF